MFGCIVQVCCLYGCYKWFCGDSPDESKKEDAASSDESGDESRVSYGLVMTKQSAEADATKNV